MFICICQTNLGISVLQLLVTCDRHKDDVCNKLILADIFGLVDLSVYHQEITEQLTQGLEAGTCIFHFTVSLIKGFKF